MDSKTSAGVKVRVKTGFLDTVIEKGIFSLLIFTPLAFGSVQIWSAAVMEIAAFVIFAAWLFKQSGAVMIQDKTLITLFGLFAAVVVLQLVPLSESVLNIVSPKTGELYKRFGSDPGPHTGGTLSIYPWATRQELLKLLAYASIFFVIINHYRTREMIDGLIRGIVYIGLFLVIFAIIQKMTWNGRLFWIYPIEAHRESVRNFMVWGPFINRNHFAGYLELVIPLALGKVLYLTAKSRESGDRGLHSKISQWPSSSSILPISLWSIAALVITGAVFMTLSRGGIIAFLCSFAFFIFLAQRRRGFKQKITLMLVIAIVLFLMIIVAGRDRIEVRFQQLGEAREIKRAEILTDSFGIIRDFPFFGTGLGTFKNIYPVYQSHSSTLVFDNAHNDYIQLIIETGWSGFAAASGVILVFFFKIIRAWFKRHRSYIKAMAAGGISSCVALGVHSTMDFNLHIPSNALLLTVIAAASYSLVLNVERNEKEAGTSAA